jgi:hypothetical protein
MKPCFRSPARVAASSRSGAAGGTAPGAPGASRRFLHPMGRVTLRILLACCAPHLGGGVNEVEAFDKVDRHLRGRAQVPCWCRINPNCGL